MKVKKITTIGIFCALAMILNLFAFIPLVPTVSWLTYDPKDIIIVIGGFIYGPMTAFLMSYIQTSTYQKRCYAWIISWCYFNGH